MENNVKIQNLMKKGLYVEAKKIAQTSKFPDEIISEINKEFGDKLYKEKNYVEAIDQYIQTIGHLNPSYVI
jgi:predicted KAP-like P-loop ATPase